MKPYYQDKQATIYHADGVEGGRAMRILSLDPSSTITGYAVMDDQDGSRLRLVEAGLLKGKSTTDAVARVLTMRTELIALLSEFRPGTVLVEIPVEKQWTRTAGKRSGMAVWAGAAWALWMVILEWVERMNYEINVMDHRAVHAISNTAWTRGTSKEVRQAEVTATYYTYNPADDPGLDASDAISMAMWWHHQSKRAEAMRAMKAQKGN